MMAWHGLTPLRVRAFEAPPPGACTLTSGAEVGSSQAISLGRTASARAMATAAEAG
jgi:hypothetical protein